MRTVQHAVVQMAALALLAGLALGRDATFARLGVQIGPDPNGNGILVIAVLEGDPDEKAGIKADDRITKLDGEDVGEVADFVQHIRDHKSGDEIKLTIVREGEEKEIKVKLD
jgi:S1-C subfamily serine protease